MGGSHSRHEEHDWEEEARRQQEEEARKREQAEAEERASAARRVAEEEAGRARAMQAEAERWAAEAERVAAEARRAQESAAEEARRLQEVMERREREEAARRQREEEEERRAREEAMRIAGENARRLREAEEAADNVRIAREEAERQAEVSRKAAAAADEKAKLERAAQVEAQRLADEAERRAGEERATREEAEKSLREGRQPIELPTQQDFAKVRQSYQFTEHMFHIAIVGRSGTGKSSLINAFRGLSNRHPSAAQTDIVETTSRVTRYPDPNPQSRFAWYDVPGAGTLNVPDWQYFNSQGLYVFNCIIVLFDLRFTASDVAVLKNCERFNIPSFIVRSKSNQHIQNLAYDIYQSGSDGDEEDDDTRCTDQAQLDKAREVFVNETRENVRVNLDNAGLSQQRVYVVSKDAMLAIMTGRVSPLGVIDEHDLLRDISSV